MLLWICLLVIFTMVAKTVKMNGPLGDQVARGPHMMCSVWSPIDAYLLPLFSYLAGSKSQILLKMLSPSSGKNSKNVRPSDPVTTKNTDWLLLQVQLTRLRPIDANWADWLNDYTGFWLLHWSGIWLIDESVVSHDASIEIQAVWTIRSQDHSFPGMVLIVVLNLRVVRFSLIS